MAATDMLPNMDDADILLFYSAKRAETAAICQQALENQMEATMRTQAAFADLLLLDESIDAYIAKVTS